MSSALRGFLSTGVRRGRPVRPLVTYNTWYPYGEATTPESLFVPSEKQVSSKTFGIVPFENHPRSPPVRASGEVPAWRATLSKAAPPRS